MGFSDLTIQKKVVFDQRIHSHSKKNWVIPKLASRDLHNNQFHDALPQDLSIAHKPNPAIPDRIFRFVDPPPDFEVVVW